MLRTRIGQIISRPDRKTMCEARGEEIVNEREAIRHGLVLCWSCASQAYYQLSANKPVLAQISFGSLQSAPKRGDGMFW